MSFTDLRMEIYAIQKISAGQEITIEYIPNLTTMNRSQRRAALSEAFGFSNCLCQACSAPEEEGLKSDSRRTEVGTIVKSIERNEGSRAQKIAGLERIGVLLEAEGYQGPAEFDSVDVSNAYAVYLQMQAQSVPVSPLFWCEN